jgi:hypothetical protein
MARFRGNTTRNNEVKKVSQMWKPVYKLKSNKEIELLASFEKDRKKKSTMLYCIEVGRYCRDRYFDWQVSKLENIICNIDKKAMSENNQDFRDELTQTVLNPVRLERLSKLYKIEFIDLLRIYA